MEELQPGTRVFWVFDPRKKGTVKQTQLKPIPRQRDYYTYYVKWDDGTFSSVKQNAIHLLT